MNHIGLNSYQLIGGKVTDISIMTAVPMFHVLGLGMAIHVPFTMGGSACLILKFNTKEAINQMKRGNATVIIGVPALYISAIGNGSAGIGSGGGGTYRRAHDTSIYKSTCGTVTITSGVSRVSAEKNGDAVDAIGRSTTDKSTCGKVTLGNTVYWTGSNYVNDDCKQYLQQNTLVYEP